jgi:hypothetical protein
VNEIQVGRFNGLLHKLLDMKEGAPAPMLASEIFPTIELEAKRLEWDFLMGVRNLGTVGAIAAGIGLPCAFRLRNPADSNVVATVSQITVTALTGFNGFIFRIGSIATDLGTVFSGINRDTRDSVRGATIPSRATVADPAAGSQLHRMQCAVNVSERINFGNGVAVLAPGGFMDIVSNVDNQAVVIACQWRERTLESSETR